MNDAVKMALEALTDIRTSIECAAGCDEGIDPMAAVSEIMSAYGTAMASAYSRAADMLNILAALEQAGEPVAKLHYSGDVMEAVQQLLERGRATLDSEGYLVTHPAEAPLPTLQRLGQEFDAGEEAETLAAMLFESVGDMTWHDPRAEMLVKDEWRQLAKRGLELLHKRFPPQSRGQAFDGELPLKFDPRDAKRWWEENMREGKFVSARLAGDGYVKFQWRDADESGDYSVPWTRIALWLAALSSAKRGEEG
ncbi:hypothetical protein [Sphingobium yanoikuyae]|uniref:Uncharacterized protein n=1 Tax=Sphingobium yanoikuyae TaxID=13690 RepID=A0A0J9FK72_SPHYA|nr:hypothetical protein [Sphingobium yanoikuyae]ATP19811.1 hypothetical protein BV87_16350 [Sphingobium yanoikuyae]KMW28885.1 hypothetical protein BV87_18330 [Sphingobium yanoikuyae]